tara:strand:- start:37 stop:1224 length:1188 start_codon:yes stop_codon:yes gene_type:complete
MSKKIGVVCFDNFETIKGGWASVSGGEPFRINGIGDLSSNVLWISNLPFYYYKKLNLLRNPNIYDQQFFRTSLKQISDELGLKDKPDDVSQKVSLIFQRVYDLGMDDFQLTLDDIEYRYNSALVNCILPSSIRQIPSGEFSSVLMTAFKESTQQNQAMIGNVSKGTKARTFCFPKGAFSRTILSLPMPTNTGWKKLEDSIVTGTIGSKEDNILKGTQAFVSYCNEKLSKKAVFFRINVSYTSKFFRSFATFANGSNYQRNWVTLPELLELIKYSIVEIYEAYSCELSTLNFDFVDNDSDEYSFSRGLYLENIYTALSLPINNGEYFNPVGAYVRAYDRVMCLKAAYAFSKSNLKVGSFGTGRVIVYSKQTESKLVNDIAMEEGLIPPYLMVKENV